MRCSHMRALPGSMLLIDNLSRSLVLVVFVPGASCEHKCCKGRSGYKNCRQ